MKPKVNINGKNYEVHKFETPHMKNHEYESHSERINRLNRVHSAGVYARYRRARLRATSFTLTVVLIIACIVLYVFAR